MKSLLTIVGERVRLLRQNRGLTQAQLGEKVDLPPNYIGEIERGKKNLTLETLERLVKALNVRPEELFITNQNNGTLKKDKLIDLIKLELQRRDIKEIGLINNLVKDVLSTIDKLKQ